MAKRASQSRPQNKNREKSRKAGGIQRINLGVSAPLSPLQVKELSTIQQESYQQFLDKFIPEILAEINPILDYTEKNFQLEIINPGLTPPKYSPNEALKKGLSFEASLAAQAKLTDLETGKSETQEVYLGEIPLMTSRGTFIINGNERVVVNQLTRAPGVYFETKSDPSLKRNLYTGEIRPERGAWLGFETSKDDVLYVRINRSGRKIPLTIFLKAFGFRRREVRGMIRGAQSDPDYTFLESTLEKDASLNQEEAFLEIYERMRPGDPRILENARDYFESLFFDPRRFSLGKVGRYKINKRLNLSLAEEKKNFLLQREDLTALVKELIRLNIEQGEPDDIDHLGSRRLRSVGELAAYSFRRGLLRLERNIKERLSVAAAGKKLSPTQLVNARPIVAVINEFFGSSQLSQFMEQTNILSELSHLRVVSAVGPGGLTRERAGTAVRDVKPSHYGRVGVVETPEGPNIGLRLTLGAFARVNEYGFLTTPYRKVVHKDNKSIVTDEVVYLTADDEEQYHIAEATLRLGKKGEILEDKISVRHQGDFFLTTKEKVDLVDAHPSQMLGISAGLIPFVSSDAGNRALMGANMQRQAVPLIKPAASFVGTGFEEQIVKDSGYVLYAQTSGVVEYVDSEKIVIAGNNSRREYELIKFMRTNENTCYNQTPRVKVGQKVKQGEVLVDGPSQEAGELALGRDLLTAFMPWDGFNYEDSIVISERVVKQDLLTNIHIKAYESAVMDTKLGAEEVTRDIPNVSEEALKNLDEEGIAVIGAEVGPGDILVGKIAPKGETELTAEERLLRAIFGEKAREIRDTSLVMPHGDRGVVISVQVLSKEAGDELGPGVLKLIKVEVAQKRKIQVGDKVAGRHGSKGVIARIVRDEDMPYLKDGTPVDIILNPISILARMNIGQILETHLGWTAERLGEYYAVPAFDKLPPDLIRNKLIEAGLSESGKVELVDGRTGRVFPHPITVGYTQIMKLHHLVEDKVHARSTGPYSLVTQQPLGGKAQMGGQRLGEMEVWALEAYGAAHALQEMLTIKSDDVVGRAKAFEAIIKGIDIPEARTPEAFKLLVKELNALGLAVDTVSLEGDGH